MSKLAKKTSSSAKGSTHVNGTPMGRPKFTTDEKELREQVSKRYVEVREKLGLKQVDIVKLTGRTKTYVNKLEKGSLTITLDVMRILHEQLNVNLGWLITGTGTMLRVPGSESSPEKLSIELTSIISGLRSVRERLEDEGL